MKNREKLIRENTSYTIHIHLTLVILNMKYKIIHQYAYEIRFVLICALVERFSKIIKNSFNEIFEAYIQCLVIYRRNIIM